MSPLKVDKVRLFVRISRRQHDNSNPAAAALKGRLKLTGLSRVTYLPSAARLWQKSETQKTISLTLEDLPQPYHKQLTSSSEALAMYNQVLEQVFSLGAYQQEYQVALAAAEPRRWNRSLWVWEFDVDPVYRRQVPGFEVAIFIKRRLE